MTGTAFSRSYIGSKWNIVALGDFFDAKQRKAIEGQGLAADRGGLAM